MNALKWLWGYVKKYKISMVSVLMVTALFIVTAFVIPIVTGRIVGYIESENHDSSLLFFYIGLMIGGVVLKELLVYSRAMILENMSQNTIKSI